MDHKRKQYFIDPAFQIQFIAKFCSVVIMASLLVGALIFLFSRSSTTVTIENTKVLVKPTSDFILPALTLTVLTVTVFSALVVLVLTLLQSHRIAGPMFRLQQEINLFKQGALDRNFLIRDKDQLQALSNSLAEMAEALREKHVELNNKYHLLKQFLSEKDFGAVEAEKEQLKTLLQEISNTLKYFKT